MAMTAIPLEPIKHIAFGPVMLQTFGTPVAIGVAVAYPTPNSEYLFDYRAFSQGVSIGLL